MTDKFYSYLFSEQDINKIWHIYRIYTYTVNQLIFQRDLIFETHTRRQIMQY